MHCDHPLMKKAAAKATKATRITDLNMMEILNLIKLLLLGKVNVENGKKVVILLT